MARNRDLDELRNQEVTDIRDHIDTINKELGRIDVKIAKIETSWTWMRWVIGLNVTLWIATLGILMRVMAA